MTWKVRDALQLDAGLLVANPIPQADEIPVDVINAYIATAQSEMTRQGIQGKGVTPFLLQRIFELSEGESLKANIALVQNNADLPQRSRWRSTARQVHGRNPPCFPATARP